MTEIHKGGCLCGAVTFAVEGALPPPDGCHCSKCRKFSGHYLVGTDVKRGALTIKGEQSLCWYQSSEKVRRGFCGICGSSLFFDPVIKTDWTSVCMGAFDGPTGTKMHIHIFCADKGDYYDIADGLPQNAQ